METKPLDTRDIDPEKLYGPQDTAKFLPIRDYRTLQVWRSLGRYPRLRPRKIAGRIYYKGADIIAFLNGEPEQPEKRAARRRRASR